MPSSLYLAAAFIALTHTLMGPDHYLPFVMMGRAGQWSRSKTYLVTLLCGTAHVISSIAIGTVGIALGIGVTRLEGIEATRGELAAWALIAFGFLYGAWGLRRALKHKTHTHFHGSHEHSHAPDSKAAKRQMTPWALFVIFGLGPCEPLIPLLMYPAAQRSVWGVAAVTAIFSAVTLIVMLGAVALGMRGLSFVKGNWAERFAHCAAGFAIACSGLAIRFLGI